MILCSISFHETKCITNIRLLRRMLEMRLNVELLLKQSDGPAAAKDNINLCLLIFLQSSISLFIIFWNMALTEPTLI